MKRILFSILLGGIFVAGIFAQDIEISGFYGYTFNSNIKTYYGEYKLSNNPNYGGILSIGLAPDMFLELSYNRQDTDFRYDYGSSTEPMDVALEYYQVGGLWQMDAGNEKVKPFGLFSLGATRFYLKESYGDFDSGSVWKMSMAFGFGAKLYLADALGIRLQAGLGLPMDASGLWVGTGGGGGTFLIPTVQFDLSAGVILRIGGR